MTEVLNSGGKRSRIRLLAIISLGALILLIGGRLLAIYRTHYQLDNPFIPHRTISLIVAPLLRAVWISVIAFVVSGVFFLLRKHIVVIIICSLTILYVWYYSYL